MANLRMRAVPGLTAGLFIVPLSLVVAYLSLDKPGIVYVDWTTTLDVVNGSYIIMAPVAAGAAASAAVSLARRSELFAVTPWGEVRVLLRMCLTVGGIVVLAHLMIVAVVVGITYVNGVSGFPHVLALLPVTLVLIFAALAGGVAGLLSGTYVVVPLVTLGGYALQIFGGQLFGEVFVSFGGASEHLLGYRHRTDVLLLQALFLVAASLLVVAWGLYRRAHSPGPAWVIVPAGLVVAAAVLLGSRGDIRFVEAETAWVCSDAETQVCVVEAYEDELDDYTERVGQVARTLKSTGVPMPDAYYQAGGATPAGAGYFSITDDPTDRPLAFQLIQSAYPCSLRWTDHQLAAADALAAYAVNGSGPVYPGGPVVNARTADQFVERLTCRGS